MSEAKQMIQSLQSSGLLYVDGLTAEEIMQIIAYEELKELEKLQRLGIISASREEFRELFELQSTANKEMRRFQKLQQEIKTKPSAVTPYAPYTDTAEFKQEIQKIGSMEQSLQEMRDLQEAERQARIEAEQRAEHLNRKQTLENRIWQAVLVTIGLLTLAATILFGILGLLC